MTMMDKPTEQMNNLLQVWIESAVTLYWRHIGRHFGYQKVGGIHFLRVGRLRFSFCKGKVA